MPQLGSPETGADNYFLCVYDTGNLATQIDIPGSSANWSRRVLPGSQDMLKYRGGASPYAPHGVRTLKIYNRLNNAAKISLVAQHSLIPMPLQPFLIPEAVTVQLVNTAGGCWEGDYIAGTDPIYANISAVFKAKGE